MPPFSGHIERGTATMATATKDADTAPTAPTQTAKPPPTPWQVMREGRAGDDVHPYWVHTVTTTGLAVLATVVVSMTHQVLPLWAWVLIGVAALCAAGVLGAAFAAQTPLHIVNRSMALAMGLTLAVIGISVYAVRVEFHTDPLASPGVFAAFAVTGLLGAALYRYLWTVAVETLDPRFERGQREATRRSRELWAEAFELCGFGDITVENKPGKEDNGYRQRVVVRLDPTRHTDTPERVNQNRDKLAGAAHRISRERGEAGLGLAQVRVTALEHDLAELIVVRSNPLDTTIDPEIPAHAHAFAVTDPSESLYLGRWDEGDPLSVPVHGPHKGVIGRSGAGKSTLHRAIVVQAARRPFMICLYAAMEKYNEFRQPFREAPRDLFAMSGGGDERSLSDWARCMTVLTAGYLLYRHRSSGADPEAYRFERVNGSWQGTPAHPTVYVYLDEFDTLVKYCKPGTRNEPTITLPNGERVTAWDMIVTLGSKARSSGVELVLGSQRAVADWFRGTGWQARSANDVFGNVAHRFVTALNSHQDAQLFNVPQEAVTKLDKMSYCMMSTLNPSGNLRFAKAVFNTDRDIHSVAALAGEADTLGTLGADERAALGDWWVDGEVSTHNPVANQLGLSATSAPTVTGREPGPGEAGYDAGAAMYRKINEGLGGALDRYRDAADDDERQEQDEDSDSGLDEGGQVPAWALDALTEIRDADDPSGFDSGDGPTGPLPESPIELVAYIVDRWERSDGAPSEATTSQLVEWFGLEYLGRDGSARSAQMRLAGVLRETPISVAPREAQRQRWFALADLRAAWDRIESENDQDDDTDE